MKKNLSFVIFLVDRSGSMSSIAKDMIGGYNTYIKSQKDANLGECKVFFYQFNTAYETVYENVDVNRVAELTDETFVPRGGTALYCSLGKTIVDIGNKLSNLDESERPEKILFITITDGQNNEVLYGKEYLVYTPAQIKEMITHQTEKYGWDFVYIGANQNAWDVGNTMGISGNTKLNYVASAKGTSDMFNKLSKGTMSYRSAATKQAFAFAPEEAEEKV